MKKSIQVKSLSIRGRLNSYGKESQLEGAEVGSSDGSGLIEVRTGGITQSRGVVTFHHVSIETSCPDDQLGKPYPKWSESGLIDLAKELLAKDYIRD